MHLASSIMDGHRVTEHHLPQTGVVSASAEGGSGVYRKGSEGVPKLMQTLENAATDQITLAFSDCCKCCCTKYKTYTSIKNI